MQTVDKKMLALIARLAKVTRARKECEKLEKQLKQDVKSFMGENKVLDAGYFTVVVNTRSRTDLDLERLRFSFGRDILKVFERTITYDTMEVMVNTIDIEIIKSLEFYI